MTEISTNCASVFYLLVHAALFPRLGFDLAHYASSLEEDEYNDALAKGSLIWDYLLYTWAIESGTASLMSASRGEPISIDATGFHEALGELQTIMDLEFSVPLHPMAADGPIAWEEPLFEEMPSFEGQRLHLCARSNWTEIDFTGGCSRQNLIDEEEIETSIQSRELPIFAKPVHCSDDSGRLGQVWIRVSEDSQHQLRLALNETLESLAIIGAERARMLQQALHREQPNLSPKELSGLNGHIQLLRERAVVHADSARRLAAIKDIAERERISAAFLEHINEDLAASKVSEERSSKPSVFLSYSHDSDSHKDWVRQLSETLNENGIEPQIDAAHSSPSEGWPRWMNRQIEHTDYVLCICTPVYKERFEGLQALGTGFGSDWEGMLITQLLYMTGGQNQRVIPVLPDSGSNEDVPLVLQPYTRYRLPSELTPLLERINTSRQ